MIIRIILSIVLLAGVYFEAGWITVLTLALLMTGFELMAFKYAIMAHQVRNTAEINAIMAHQIRTMAEIIERRLR
ncbi:MAG TPA: hypothetical protein VJQ25_12720 [Nitrospira sp.]|nr:hypothetical protein [Nitrospira sp.]